MHLFSFLHSEAQGQSWVQFGELALALVLSTLIGRRAALLAGGKERVNESVKVSCHVSTLTRCSRFHQEWS